MKNIKVGYALCGSFCTFDKSIKAMEELELLGYDVTPIMSQNAYSMDTKFGLAKDFIDRIEKICEKKVIHTIQEAEPIGPKQMFDVLCVAPCTGNTLSKLAYDIVDTCVTMAVKSHLRNMRPVVLGVSTNDALGNCAQSIGRLLNYKNIYFIPMKQDDYTHKPRSVVAEFSLLEQALQSALNGVQIQPIYLPGNN